MPWLEKLAQTNLIIAAAFAASATTATAQPVPHQAGELIVETDEYRVHFSRQFQDQPAAQCSRGSIQTVSFVIKRGAASEAAMTENWLLPRIVDAYSAVKERCSDPASLVANVFFDGVYLRTDAEETSRENVARGLTKEERFGAIMVNFQGPAPRVSRINLFHRTPIGSGPDERATLAGLRAIRDNGWKTRELVLAEEERAARQRALLGFEVPSIHVFAIFERGDDLPWLFDRSHREGRHYAGITAQAYGLSAMEKCGDRIPGGLTKKTISFQNNFGRIVESKTITIPAELGAAAHNYIPNEVSGGFIFLYSAEARKGPIRDSVDAILRSAPCMSETHLRLHRNVIAAARGN